MPESITHGRCGMCVALFAVLDIEQGEYGRSFKGWRALAERMSWKRDTVRVHVDHLVRRGYLTVVQEGQHKAVFVVHNPVRKSYVPPGEEPAGWVPADLIDDNGGGPEIGPPGGPNLGTPRGSEIGPPPSSLLSVRSASESDALVASNDARREELSQRDARATGPDMKNGQLAESNIDQLDDEWLELAGEDERVGYFDPVEDGAA